MGASFLAYYKYVIDGFTLFSVAFIMFMNMFRSMNLSLIFIFLSYAVSYTSFFTFCVLNIITVCFNKGYEEPDESFYNYYNSQNERASRHFRNCKEGQTVLSYHYETEDGQVIFAYYRRENGNMKKRIGTERKEDFSAHTWDYGKI
jgi:hypothetical protein